MVSYSYALRAKKDHPMKRAFLLCVAISFSCLVLFGQRISITNESNSFLYLEIDNTLTIAVENYSCKLLHVKIDNGEIRGEEGYYTVRPKVVGTATITILTKQNG